MRGVKSNEETDCYMAEKNDHVNDALFTVNNLIDDICVFLEVMNKVFEEWGNAIRQLIDSFIIPAEREIFKPNRFIISGHRRKKIKLPIRTFISRKERTIMITWEQLVEVEPRLAELLEEIKKVKDNPEEPSFCANYEWYVRERADGRSFKRKMISLVGSEAETSNRLLSTSEAYDLAYGVLYDTLPGCRNCTCL